MVKVGAKLDQPTRQVWIIKTPTPIYELPNIRKEMLRFCLEIRPCLEIGSPVL